MKMSWRIPHVVAQVVMARFRAVQLRNEPTPPLIAARLDIPATGDAGADRWNACGAQTVRTSFTTLSAVVLLFRNRNSYSDKVAMIPSYCKQVTACQPTNGGCLPPPPNRVRYQETALAYADVSRRPRSLLLGGCLMHLPIRLDTMAEWIG